jgi:hypothetical protein
MTTGAVQTLSTDSVSALLYAADWRQLFFSTQLALYTYELKGQNGAYAETAHVWIGGNLDYAPIDMTFDVQGSNLWLVDNITAHRLNSAGMWDRFGYKQYAPINDISSVTVHNGVVYVGSASKGMSRLINSDIPSGKPAANGDPWAWTYYGGARYLPNNNVTALFAEPDSVDSSTMIYSLDFQLNSCFNYCSFNSGRVCVCCDRIRSHAAQGSSVDSGSEGRRDAIVPGAASRSLRSFVGVRSEAARRPD